MLKISRCRVIFSRPLSLSLCHFILYTACIFRLPHSMAFMNDHIVSHSLMFASFRSCCFFLSGEHKHMLRKPGISRNPVNSGQLCLCTRCNYSWTSVLTISRELKTGTSSRLRSTFYIKARIWPKEAAFSKQDWHADVTHANRIMSGEILHGWCCAPTRDRFKRM